MRVVETPLTKIKPYKRNPRKNDGVVEYVVNSIKEFGFMVPLVIGKDGTIIAGHTRYKAAKKLGLKKVPCVLAGDLTEEQMDAFRLADNKTQELAEWDWQKIGMELGAVKEIDMRLMGFAEFLDVPEPGEAKKKELGGGHEIDVGSFDDDAFSCVCPCCGFRFNE